MNQFSKLTTAQSVAIPLGSVIRALYVGSEPCKCVVIDSRIKYGGKVGYTCMLMHDMRLSFRKEVYKKGMSIGINNTEILEILE